MSAVRTTKQSANKATGELSIWFADQTTDRTTNESTEWAANWSTQWSAHNTAEQTAQRQSLNSANYATL